MPNGNCEVQGKQASLATQHATIAILCLTDCLPRLQIADLQRQQEKAQRAMLQASEEADAARAALLQALQLHSGAQAGKQRLSSLLLSVVPVQGSEQRWH